MYQVKNMKNYIKKFQNYQDLFLDYYEEHKDDVKIICICCTNKNEFYKRLESKFYKTKTQAYSEYYGFYYDIVKDLYMKLNIEYFTKRKSKKLVFNIQKFFLLNNILNKKKM